MEKNSESNLAVNVTGLLLCAGLSARMGALKPLMLHEGLPFAVQIIRKLLHHCSNIYIIVGYKADKIRNEISSHLYENELAKIKFSFNKNYQRGMFSSLQCGLQNLKNVDWILYHFVDQPSLPEIFYKNFFERLNKKINWLQPAYHKKLGHPILFDAKVAEMILQLSENHSLRDLNNDSRIKRIIWNCSYPQVLEDIDTMDEFKNLTVKQVDN